MIDYFKENITWNSVIIAIALSVFYDLIKRILFWLLKNFSKIAKWKSNKNVIFLIKYYKSENEQIEKIANKDGVFLKKIAKDLIYDSIFGFIILSSLLILNNIENRILFFGALGSCFIILLKVFAGFIHNIKLFYKAKHHKKYVQINNNRISKLEKISS